MNIQTTIYLQQHVAWLYPPICCHRSSLHDRADVDATISSIVTLAHYTDAEKVIFLCANKRENGRDEFVSHSTCTCKRQADLTHIEGNCDDVEAHG